MNSCLKIGEFQQYLDGVRYAGARNPEIETHLAGCARCHAAFGHFKARSGKVDELLSALAPAEDPTADPMAALAALRERLPMEAHLARLAAGGAADVPWYVSLSRNLRDLIRGEGVEPLDVTSHPVPVKEIWGLYSRNPRSRYAALGIHAALFTVLMFGAASNRVQVTATEHYDLIDPVLRPWTPKQLDGGGGGGGAREPQPVTAGQLPKPALKQFVPPAVVDHTPVLAVMPSIVAPPDTPLPDFTLNNWGDPLAKMMNGSNGSGFGGGMGNGSGGGVGPGNGLGYGPGEGKGVNGGVYQPGGSVSAPVPIYKADPEYSEEARKAKYKADLCCSDLWWTRPAMRRDIRVLRSVGMGLDEKAIEAVQKWRFKPGMKNGQAVNVSGTGRCAVPAAVREAVEVVNFLIEAGSVDLGS